MYHDLVDFTRIGDFTWRASDCEGLVGFLTGDGVGLGAKSSDSTELY